MHKGKLTNINPPRITTEPKKRLSLKTAVYLLLTFLMNNHGNYKTGSAEISGFEHPTFSAMIPS